MSIIKTALVATALTLAVVATAIAQGNEKTGPTGNYLPTPTSSGQPAPVGQTPANGDYKNEPVPPPGTPAPIGQTKANGDYQPTGK
jgi:hypothetical protein